MLYACTTRAQEAMALPDWYGEAKFGIMIHWGIYSVPAWNYSGEINDATHWSEKLQAYGEWYWHSLDRGHAPAMEFHNTVYGEAKRYQDFVAQFKAELFNPDQWAAIFQNAGAKYVVMVAKHHDGFALWPSAYSWNWNSMDVGPHRDLLGDLTMSVKATGLRMGISYSLDSWFDPLYIHAPMDYMQNKLQPQLKEVVMAYRPDIIVAGGHSNYTMREFQNDQFLDWLYTQSPVKDEVVVNDRWGKDTNKKIGSYFNTQYSDINAPKNHNHKWEEMRGIGKSFGYSRVEVLDDYMSSEELVEMLVRVVAEGGNLLLNIGPTADGRIPVIMQQRLADVGSWLKVNGEAIYKTEPETIPCNITSKATKTDSAQYVHLLEWPQRHIELSVKEKIEEIHLLGVDEALAFDQQGDKVSVTFPYQSINPSNIKYVYVLKLESRIDKE